MKNIKKYGIGAGITLGFAIIISGLLLMANMGEEPFVDTKLGKLTIEIGALGENTPAAGESGFLSIFLLDYGEDPAVVLANNATDWENSATVHAYADGDAFIEDCPSEDPFYIVVRARFNATHCKDGGDWIHERARVKITISGDETLNTNISRRNCTGANNASVSGYSGNMMFVNFWWTDGVDGYRITDDGSITVSLIQIEAKY